MTLAATGFAALALAIGLTACGGGGDSSSVVPGGAEHADVQVIDEWATDLRKGDIDAAAALFAIPSTAQNGPIIVKISKTKDAELFNRSLPCGAKLIRAEPSAGSILATFKLTDRPGGDCGPGAGNEAQTSFQIADGKITGWTRVDDSGTSPKPSGDQVS